MNNYMPKEDGLHMPVQNLCKTKKHSELFSVSFRTKVARTLLILLTFVLSFSGAGALYCFLRPRFFLIRYKVFFVFFSLNLLWISFSAASAVIGFIFRYFLCDWKENSPNGTKTAIVMPLYNEDPFRSYAALEAIAGDLQRKFAADCFEIVILSDSSDPVAVEKEKHLYTILEKKIGQIMSVWYRHRTENSGRKAGNIADFIRRWGKRYTYMIVLDADSLMSAETLITMVGRMQGDKKIGILQTVPVLYAHGNFFSRLQQFASRIYGGITAEGITAWSGNEGNYWGHNAIIRIKAFAACCGLPKLRGRKPFGGDILSHDFVEAALIRRAGWKVKIAADLHDSWEESPPSLLDLVARDRRWTQGNLQHIKVLRAKGLLLCSRLHFLVGITGYLASLLWLGMICSGLFIICIGTGLGRFSAGRLSFQNVFNMSQTVFLFKLCVYTMIVLFLPKILGCAGTLSCSDLRKKCGGYVRILVGVVVEILFSILLSPILMLFNTKNVFEILSGQDSGWHSQRRMCRGISWKESWQALRFPFLIGLAVLLVLLYHVPGSAGCFFPVLAGLLFSVPLIKMSSSEKVGSFFAHMQLFLIPEETTEIPLLRTRDLNEKRLRQDYPAQSLSAYVFRLTGVSAATSTDCLAQSYITDNL